MHHSFNSNGTNATPAFMYVVLASGLSSPGKSREVPGSPGKVPERDRTGHWDPVLGPSGTFIILFAIILSFKKLKMY